MELKEKQKQILSAAVTLFKEKGYAGCSVREIATKLNIKAASLYTHIHSKEELLEWVCFGIAEDFFSALETVKNAKIPTNQKLNLFIELHLKVVLKNKNITQIYSNEWKHLENKLNDFLQLRKKYQDQVQLLVAEIFENENWELQNPTFTTKFILFTLNNSYHWIPKNEASSPEIINEIKNKVLFGLLGK